MITEAFNDTHFEPGKISLKKRKAAELIFLASKILLKKFFLCKKKIADDTPKKKNPEKVSAFGGSPGNRVGVGGRSRPEKWRRQIINQA